MPQPTVYLIPQFKVDEGRKTNLPEGGHLPEVKEALSPELCRHLAEPLLGGQLRPRYLGKPGALCGIIIRTRPPLRYLLLRGTCRGGA